MTDSEEKVYSSMGFDPILLLDEPPLSDNYLVNIVRPNVDLNVANTNEIIKETQQDTIINEYSNNKKNHKDIINPKDKKNNNKSSNVQQTENIEKTNINLDLATETDASINSDQNLNNVNKESSSIGLEEVNEDPRRKRRRSSASS